MKNLVINFTKCTEGSTIASNRIAKFIALETGFLLVDDLQVAKQLAGEKIGSIYVVNGLFGFCNFRELCVELCESADQLIWVGNDYNIKKPTQLKKFNFLNVCQYLTGGGNETLMDWNKLTHIKGLPAQKPLHNGLMYYGAFRENRLEAFKRYFDTDLYDVLVSTTSKNESKFSGINKDIKIVKPFKNVIKDSSVFGNTIYIEDEDRPADIYLTPANRFYECIAAKTLQLIDSKCKQSFEAWEIDDYIVSSPADVKAKLNDSELLKKQIEYFSKYDFKAELKESFKLFHLDRCLNLEGTQLFEKQSSLF